MKSGEPAAAPRVVIIGAGPAGLMAAQTLAEAGLLVDVYDAMSSVGRKFLRAGVGGLNLTHAEPPERFVRRYGERQLQVGAWLRQLDAAGVQDWAQALGIDTFVGSSQRVFPTDFKAAPLLRAWLRHLRGLGVRLHVRQRWLGFTAEGALRMQGAEGMFELKPDATLLALGGGSWPQLGSDAGWVEMLQARGVVVSALQPANCGFEVAWSPLLRERFAGQPLKPVRLHHVDLAGVEQQQQGELMITAHGLEGGLIYACSAQLRELIRSKGSAQIQLDLLPGRSAAQLQHALQQPRGSMSWSKWLQRRAGLDALRIALLHEAGVRSGQDVTELVAAIKRLPLQLRAPRPLAEAISTAGGVCFAALDQDLMLLRLPGVFCAGEMLDWEAPTGGYLLTACLASGKVAAQGMLAWLRRQTARVAD